MAIYDSPRDNISLGGSGFGGSGAGVAVLLGLVGGAVLGKLFQGHHGFGLGCGPHMPMVGACAPAAEASVTADRIASANATGTILQTVIENARTTTDAVITDAAARNATINGILSHLGEGQLALAGGIKDVICRVNESSMALQGSVKDSFFGVSSELTNRFNCLNEKLTQAFSVEDCKIDKIIDLLTGVVPAITSNAAMQQQALQLESMRNELMMLRSAKSA